MSGPLEGVKVLEFSQIIAGPLACQLLADLGADVIKVEPPQGEPWRLIAPFVPLESKNFQALNRGKKSLAIDLTAPAAAEVIRRLVEKTDVVVINHRPDVAAHLKIDYETLSLLKPDLIYIENTAFGRKGDLAGLPGYDIVVQAFTGLIASVGRVDGGGTPIVPPPFVDVTTAYAIVAGVSAALFNRSRTGQGSFIETSLLINALILQMQWFMSLPAADADQRAELQTAIEEARVRGTRFDDILRLRDRITRANAGTNPYYRCYLTSDGAIAIGALSKELREKIRRVLNLDHNRDEPGYDATDPAQQEIDKDVIASVEKMIRANTSVYWEERFRRGGVPVSRLNFAHELLDDPQVLANDYVVALEHDLTGPQRMAAPPWKMSSAAPEARSASPPLGRDNDAILASLGFAEPEIAALRGERVIL
jgi:formyl-CoA transferase